MIDEIDFLSESCVALPYVTVIKSESTLCADQPTSVEDEIGADIETFSTDLEKGWGLVSETGQRAASDDSASEDRKLREKLTAQSSGCRSGLTGA